MSQTDYSGIGHVRAFLQCCTELGAPRAILGAPMFDMIVLLKRCRSSFVGHSKQASCNAGQHRSSAQLSFSRSQVHVCLQALSVPAFERVPEDLRFLLPLSIRPSLCVVDRNSSPYTPLVAHASCQLVTGGDFVSKKSALRFDSAQLTDSDLHSLTAPQIVNSLPICSQPLNMAHLFTLAFSFSLLFRRASTLSSKLTCANYHRLGVIARAGERGSRARNASQTFF